LLFLSSLTRVPGMSEMYRNTLDIKVISTDDNGIHYNINVDQLLSSKINKMVVKMYSLQVEYKVSKCYVVNDKLKVDNHIVTSC